MRFPCNSTAFLLQMKYATDLLTCLLVQAYRWEDNVAVVEWLSQQLEEEGWQQSFLCENIRCVQRDHVMQRMRS